MQVIFLDGGKVSKLDGFPKFVRIRELVIARPSSIQENQFLMESVRETTSNSAEGNRVSFSPYHDDINNRFIIIINSLVVIWDSIREKGLIYTL